MIIGISGKMKSGKDTIGRIIQYLTSDYVNKCDFETYLTYIIDFPEWKIKKFAGKLKEIVSILTGIPVGDLEKQEVKDRVLGEEWDKLQITFSNGFDEVTEIFPINFDFNTLLDAKGRTAYIHKKEVLKMTVRQLLQEVGTDAMRNIIHPNTWVNALFADYTTKKYSIGINKYGHQTIVDKHHSWIVTDCRFKNELQAIKDRGGITIRVERFTSIKNDLVYFKNDSDDSPINGIYRILEVKEDNCTLIDDKTGYSFGAWFEEISKINEHESETALDNATFDYIIDNNGTIEELVIEVKEILIKEKIL